MRVVQARDTTSLVDTGFPLRLEEVDIKDTEEEPQLDWEIEQFFLRKRRL